MIRSAPHNNIDTSLILHRDAYQFQYFVFDGNNDIMTMGIGVCVRFNEIMFTVMKFVKCVLDYLQ